MAFDRPLESPESSVPPDLSVANDGMDEPDLRRGDRTGQLVIRAWVEEGSRQPLRMQIRLTTDVSKGYQRAVDVSDKEAVCAAVEDWLKEVMGEPASPD